MKDLSIKILSGLCVIASMYIGTAYALNECSTTMCGCQIHKCPTHAGNFCTSKNIQCDLHGNKHYACNLWCTTFSNTCKGAGGQNGSSECGTID